MMGWPLQDPVIFGVFGSVGSQQCLYCFRSHILFIAFGLIFLLGLKSPLKFVPVLLLQLTYKTIWFAGVALPLLLKGQLKGQFPTHGYLFAAILIYIRRPDSHTLRLPIWKEYGWKESMAIN